MHAFSASHDAVPDAPHGFEFNNPEAVSEAHRNLAQTPALNRFCGLAFDDRDKPGSRDALATLILYKGADAQQQSHATMAQSHEDARTTLATHLSATGTTELLHTLDVHAEPNTFSQCLAQTDRRFLAAQGEDR